MKCIVGLGNPGDRYEHTRHNIGFIILDRWAAQHSISRSHNRKRNAMIATHSIGSHRLLLVKPLTYMNRSGSAVRAAIDYYTVAPADTLVIHDEIDLPTARLQCKMGGGHAGHNGLRDIIAHLATRDFARLRVGVDRPAIKAMVADYVLGRFGADEIDAIMTKRETIDDRLTKRITNELGI